MRGQFVTIEQGRFPRIDVSGRVPQWVGTGNAYLTTAPRG
jgi:hypothetical protein